MRVHASIPVLTLLAGIAVGAVLGVLLSGGPSAHNTTSGATPPAERVDGTNEQASPPENRQAALTPSPDNDADDAPETASEAASAPLDVERYEIRGRVEDPEGNGVGGVRFRWHPDLTDAFRDQPAAEDFSDDESFQAAVRAHMERLTQLKLQGPQDVVSADDGTLEIADSVAAGGWLELQDDSYVFSQGSSDNRERILSSRRDKFRITICPAAELDLRVLIDGRDAESATVFLQYSAQSFTFALRGLELPATARVPVGEAQASIYRSNPRGEVEAQTIVIRQGQRNRLVLRADAPHVLRVETDLPPGSSARIEVKPASDTLSDEQVAVDDSIKPLRARGNGNRVEVEVESTGEYVVAVRADDVLLAFQRVTVTEGANRVSLSVPEPEDMTRIVMRVTVEGEPISDSWKPFIDTSVRVPEFLWSRTGNEFVWLIQADGHDSASEIARVILQEAGVVTQKFNPHSPQTLYFQFEQPSELTVELTGAHPEMAGEFRLLADAVDTGFPSWNRATGKQVSSDETKSVWHFQALQPGEYQFKIYWLAGVAARGSEPLRTVRVGTKSSKVHIELPSFHVLSIELPEKTVRGSISVRDSHGEVVASESQSHRSPITHIRFLRTGDYTVEYTDREGREHSHQVTLDKDTVISP